MSQWQPIETAPKDGTMFIGWVSAERHSQIDGEGSGYGHDTSEADFCQWKAVVSHPDGGYFDNMMGQIGDAQAVTHWIPIPPPPTTQPEIQKGNADLVPVAKCSRCKGAGWIRPAARWGDGYTCPRCLGTGRVGRE